MADEASVQMSDGDESSSPAAKYLKGYAQKLLKGEPYSFSSTVDPFYFPCACEKILTLLRYRSRTLTGCFLRDAMFSEEVKRNQAKN